MGKKNPGLGLNLGIGDPKKRKEFQAAAAAGTGEDWLSQHPGINKRVEQTLKNRPDSQKADRIQSFLHGDPNTGALPGTTPWKGGGGQGGAQPPAAAPTPTPPPETPIPPGPAAGPKPTLADIAQKYQIAMPEELKAAGAGAMDVWNRVKDPLTMDQLNAAVPDAMRAAGAAATDVYEKSKDWQNSAYEEQFNRLMQQSAEAGDINAAKIRESMGSMGARYGSDIMTSEADMRRKQTLDLQTAGFDVRQQLNAARQRDQEMGLTGMNAYGTNVANVWENAQAGRRAEMAGAMGAMENVGASKGNIMQSGMEKAWQDYMMQMAPPAMWDEMMGYATSFNPPGQAVY